MLSYNLRMGGKGTKLAPNGCPVAKRVERKKTGFRVPSENIAAIDFGTTNCSLAYMTAGDRSEEGSTLLPLGDGTYYRAPTAILFTPQGEIDSFGHFARDRHKSLDDKDQQRYAYFEFIKMDLQHDETVSRDMEINASNGKEYYLVDVIAQILNYLKNELIENHLKKAGYPLKATDFDWVITVPAIWKARGKQMMREAGYKAGLCSNVPYNTLQPASLPYQEPPSESNPDKLSLALEPESASILCQNMMQQQTRVADSSFLVVDIGGGTVDISACTIVSSGGQAIEVVYPPTGNNCGGVRVNEEFKRFLENLVGDPGFSRYLKNPQNRSELSSLLYETFEKQKKIFSECLNSSEEEIFGISLPYTFMCEYKGDMQSRLQQCKVELSSQLLISYKQMKCFFEPSINGLLSCMAETMGGVQAKIETICLVGGFGGCKYVKAAVEKEFGMEYKYIVPTQPSFAVVRGAVLYRRNPAVVRARTVDATYGIESMLKFNPSIHDEDYRWTDDDGKHYCDHIFQTIVEREEVVSTKDVFTAQFTPAYHNQKRAKFTIFRSPERGVWYTTGKTERGSQPVKIGEFEVEMPILTRDKSRQIEVLFDFSHTEIQAKGRDRTSGREVKVVMDFLST